MVTPAEELLLTKIYLQEQLNFYRGYLRETWEESDHPAAEYVRFQLRMAISRIEGAQHLPSGWIWARTGSKVGNAPDS